MTHPLRPLRFWMTGCVAVVSLAIGGTRTAWADERGAPGRSARFDWKPSRFDLAETLHRLEACAERHGLGVLVRWVPGEAGAAPEVPASCQAVAPRRAGAVLVFEPLSGAGTPVVMHADESVPDLPLSLCVRTGEDGRAEVRLPSPAGRYADELPPEVARELTELPALVADALA